MATEGDVFDALGSAVAALLFLPATLAVLAVGWIVAFLFSVPFGDDAALLGATVGTLGLALAAVLADTPDAWGARLRIAVYVLAIALAGIATAVAVWLVVALAVLFAGWSGVAVPTASAVALALWAALGVGVVLAIRDAGPVTDWSLTLRMVAATLLLALLTVCFLTAVWVATWIAAVFVVFLVSADFGLPFGVALPATALTALALALFVRRELGHVRTVERHADATPVDPADAPYYYALTARVAAQLDVPMPTLAHSPRRVPEAMVVGFRPRNVHLVLSEGTIEALDRDELTAVIAHELAHVANRDAMVTTAVSLPVVLADGIRARLTGAERAHRPAGDDAGDGPEGVEWTDLDEQVSYDPNARHRDEPVDDDADGSTVGAAIGFVVAGPTQVLGRLIVAVLSRARETVADRTAAESMGSPATLASALRTLDDRIRAAPERDLRAAAPVSTLSILPLDRAADPDEFEARGGPLGLVRSWYARVRRRLFRCHPPTERRIADLEAFAGEDRDED